MELEVTNRGGLHVGGPGVQDHVLPGMRGEPHVHRAHALADLGQPRLALATCPWNCGSSGCVAYGASDELIRYIEMS